MALELIKQEYTEFEEAYKKALTLEAIYALRGNKRPEDRETGLFQIREEQNMTNNPEQCSIGHKDQGRPAIKCYSCGINGHISNEWHSRMKQSGRGQNTGF